MRNGGGGDVIVAAQKLGREIWVKCRIWKILQKNFWWDFSRGCPLSLHFSTARGALSAAWGDALRCALATSGWAEVLSWKESLSGCSGRQSRAVSKSLSHSACRREHPQEEGCSGWDSASPSWGCLWLQFPKCSQPVPLLPLPKAPHFSTDLILQFYVVPWPVFHVSHAWPVSHVAVMMVQVL